MPQYYSGGRIAAREGGQDGLGFSPKLKGCRAGGRRRKEGFEIWKRELKGREPVAMVSSLGRIVS